MHSILLFTERIVLFTTSTCTTSNVLFTSVENDSKSPQVMASCKTSWCNFLLTIWKIFSIGFRSGLRAGTYPYLVPSSSGFCTNLLWVTILQKKLPSWVDRSLKHASKKHTNKMWELFRINSTMILFSYSYTFPIRYCGHKMANNSFSPFMIPFAVNSKSSPWSGLL